MKQLDTNEHAALMAELKASQRINLADGAKVVSTEMPGAVGTVIQRYGDGSVRIEWVYQPTTGLSFGLINVQLWKKDDLHLLEQQ